VQVWTLPEGKLQRRWTTDFGVGAMLATADGKRIIAGHQGGIDVFDAASGRRLKKLKGGATVSRMLLHPDQRRLVSADEDGIVRVWNIETGSMEQTLTAYDRNDAEIAALAWSNDLRSLIAGDNQGVLRFWNVGSWDYTGGITVCSQGNCIREVQMARDGQSLELVVGSGLAERHFARLPLQVSVEE
jgi:WD40 repeat protein